MIDIIRIKRRSADGKPGPPDTLAPSELAYNEADDILYYGKGDDGLGGAIEIVPIASAAALSASIDALSEIRAIRDELAEMQKNSKQKNK